MEWDSIRLVDNIGSCQLSSLRSESYFASKKQIHLTSRIFSSFYTFTRYFQKLPTIYLQNGKLRNFFVKKDKNSIANSKWLWIHSASFTSKGQKPQHYRMVNGSRDMFKNGQTTHPNVIGIFSKLVCFSESSNFLISFSTDHLRRKTALDQ